MLSEAQRLARNAYIREWKASNKDKVNASNRRVKAKNPDLYKKINRISMAKQRALDPERFAAQVLKEKAANPEQYLWRHARNRARKLGVAFDLEVADITVPMRCPVLGIELKWGRGQRASANHASPSLDRMDPDKGYVKGNVFVISNRANHLKNNGRLDEFEAIVAYMKRAR